MTKGIRAYTNAKFVELLPQLPELGNAGFRRKVMEAIAQEFGVTSAASHYNFALKKVRGESPELVAGLGRPEDKKGGRPVLHPVTVVYTRSGKVVAEGISKASAQEMITKGGTLKDGKFRLSIKVDAVVAEAKTEEAAAEATV